MNIFAVDSDPVLCAQALDDKRLLKMILETAQILSSALSNLGYWKSNLYRPTHVNHPCVQWAGASRRNFDWLVLYGIALGQEYKHRFGRFHRSVSVVMNASERFKDCPLDALSMTPFPNCTGWKGRSVQDAYRAYLSVDKWTETSRWTKRSKPEWYNKYLGKAV